MTVFISIASYRDAELLPTIEDCLAKAARPDDLRFGVCWQHDEHETLGRFRTDPRFRIIDVDWRASLGACWARSQIMGLYAGEDHFLQIDSHHRFAPGWDQRLIGHLSRADSPKPVLSTYLPNYTPGTPPGDADPVATLEFAHFTNGGVPLLRGARMPPGTPLDHPVPARFLSGHFLFAYGSFVAEVPYDPQLYFHGEEITMSVRAWTHGYDFFFPPENLMWHYYTRPASTKHWDDHSWQDRDQTSKRRIRRLLHGQEQGRFGAGPARTVAEYERFVGLDFASRLVTDRPEHRPHELVADGLTCD